MTLLARPLLTHADHIAKFLYHGLPNMQFCDYSNSSIPFIMQMTTPEHFKRLLVDAFAKSTARPLVEPGLQRAGVLVPIVSNGGAYNFLFTKRTLSVETHKGQISFPGGAADPRDYDITDTALREAHEEVGIPRSAVEILGVLDDLETPTGFLITPVVGLIENLPPLSINVHEVAEVFQVPVQFFADATKGRKELRVVGGRKREVWYYDTGDHVIWGATAIILRSLMSMLGMI